MNHPIIIGKNLTKKYEVDGKIQTAINDVDISVNQGEFLCIIGPSGCGKSTLLRILLGLEKATSGSVHKTGNPRPAMIFQNFAVFPWLTVEENVGFGLKMQGLDKKEIETKVKVNIEAMGLSGFENSRPKELSGGMKQRVGIARALAVEPDVLFMDEPFSALDAFTARKLRRDILKVWEQKNITVVMVTHLVDEAVELADRVVVMAPHPGTIIKTLDVSLPRPRNRRSADFYGQSDRIEHLIVA